MPKTEKPLERKETPAVMVGLMTLGVLPTVVCVAVVVAGGLGGRRLTSVGWSSVGVCLPPGGTCRVPGAGWHCRVPGCHVRVPGRQVPGRWCRVGWCRVWSAETAVPDRVVPDWRAGDWQASASSRPVLCAGDCTGGVVIQAGGGCVPYQ